MTETKNEANKKAAFGLLALVLSMLALVGAVSHFWLGPIEQPPSLEDTITNQAAMIKDQVVAKLKGEELPPENSFKNWGSDRLAMAGIAGVSVLSILLSVVGFIRHEPTRVVGSAAALGCLALALQYLGIAV